jgi:F-type H+-transporting ATPase subunit b
MSVDLAWVTVLVFLSMVVVLLMFAAKPIRLGLDSREKHVGEQLDEAERRNREAEELLKKHQLQLAAASEQIKQMLDEARKSADSLREQEAARTRESVQRERDRAVAEIDAAKGRALQEVANRAADTAVNLAGRIIRAELKRDDHAALVAQAIDQFPGGKQPMKL